ncbi:MAG TPA: peptidase [Azospirillaceae bacterium]|nr:peptidase [Azospirillaceae bacterium]HRQ80317.1 peptidase [Azospirillaceae bacterium]
MTYCLGIKTADGLVALADGRITSGSQLSAARKVTMMGAGGARFFIMSSGLRSVRDKTLAYLRRDMSRLRSDNYTTMLDAVTAFTECLRKVAEEDKEALEASRLHFNLHAILGGQLADDAEPTMYLVYPEGNWIEVDERTPYLSIGATAYGKPILDRALRYDTNQETALKLAYLSFDSTRFSSTDVGYPIDMVLYQTKSRSWRTANYDYDDLVEQRRWWNVNITKLVEEMPDGPWLPSLLP